MKLIGIMLAIYVHRLVRNICRFEYTLLFPAPLDKGPVLEDLYYPHPMVQDILWGSLHYVYEPIFTRWPTKN
ncbi:hypothetical protein ACFX13_025524 [Malus domestica]